MQLVTSILHPERLKAIGESTLTMDAIRTLWPPELSGPKAPKFIDFLKHQYDHSQLEAIEVGLLLPTHILYASATQPSDEFHSPLGNHIHYPTPPHPFPLTADKCCAFEKVPQCFEQYLPWYVCAHFSFAACPADCTELALKVHNVCPCRVHVKMSQGKKKPHTADLVLVHHADGRMSPGPLGKVGTPTGGPAIPAYPGTSRCESLVHVL